MHLEHLSSCAWSESLYHASINLQLQWGLWRPLQIVIDVVLYDRFGALVASCDVALPMLVLPLS
jgi:hypothetical protein